MALIGSETDVKTIMAAARWYAAHALGLRSDLQIAVDTVLKRPDDEAPVSSLYLFGRKEDLAFEQPVGDSPRHRHHVRFWRAEKAAADGRPVWVGSAVYDERVGFSRTTGQITHVTAPMIDVERDYLFHCLEQTGDLSETYIVDDFHKVRKGRNGGGDPWETDGRLFAALSSRRPPPRNRYCYSPLLLCRRKAKQTCSWARRPARTATRISTSSGPPRGTAWPCSPTRPTFAKARLTPQQGDVTIGKRKYRAEIGAAAGCVRETGPDGERSYPIAHVMGGKNVYYFLTPLDRGRLQVLPVAYDVHKKAWYDMAASGVRHFPDRRDEALDWTDRMFAFNTTCFNCHVTELATNYDLATDTYHTTWAEPGISCESCHGPAKEHVRVMEKPGDGPHVEGHQDHPHQGVHAPRR